MNRYSRFVVVALAAVVMAGTLTGCSAFRMSVKDKDPATAAPLTAKYDQVDHMNLAKAASDALFSAPFPKTEGERPIIVEMGIKNSTRSHLDMKALADTMVTQMMDSQKVQFVDASIRDNLLKEQGFQLANCTPETRVSIGKQLGAKYMLSGNLTEITTESGKQVRVSKTQDVYYQLTIDLTNVETGILEVRKQVQRMREASKPIIGW